SAATAELSTPPLIATAVSADCAGDDNAMTPIENCERSLRSVPAKSGGTGPEQQEHPFRITEECEIWRVASVGGDGGFAVIRREAAEALDRGGNRFEGVCDIFERG